MIFRPKTNGLVCLQSWLRFILVSKHVISLQKSPAEQTKIKKNKNFGQRKNTWNYARYSLQEG